MMLQPWSSLSYPALPCLLIVPTAFLLSPGVFAFFARSLPLLCAVCEGYNMGVLDWANLQQQVIYPSWRDVESESLSTASFGGGERLRG